MLFYTVGVNRISHRAQFEIFYWKTMMGIQETFFFSELMVLLLLTHHASFLQASTSNSVHLQK